VNLRKSYDFSQIPRFPRLPSAPSVGHAKALRSWMELAIAHPTTRRAFPENRNCEFDDKIDVVDLQLKKTTTFLELQVDVRLGVERRPCCSSLRYAQQVRAERLATAASGALDSGTLCGHPAPTSLHVSQTWSHLPMVASRWPLFVDARRVLSKPLR
jgi:hypothetical protein